MYVTLCSDYKQPVLQILIINNKYLFQIININFNSKCNTNRLDISKHSSKLQASNQHVHKYYIFSQSTFSGTILVCVSYSESSLLHAAILCISRRQKKKKDLWTSQTQHNITSLFYKSKWQLLLQFKTLVSNTQNIYWTKYKTQVKVSSVSIVHCS